MKRSALRDMIKEEIQKIVKERGLSSRTIKRGMKEPEDYEPYVDSKKKKKLKEDAGQNQIQMFPDVIQKLQSMSANQLLDVLDPNEISVIGFTPEKGWEWYVSDTGNRDEGFGPYPNEADEERAISDLILYLLDNPGH